ncbi:hypothetical protein OG909_22500 [Streptomyces sp. NBC_01754]|uniref:hypothetical protein n=1 Tax=Streptomyces sp. NBC_01754 TaxID=2975930 RepID=UPI002DD7EBA4|nr:hypothetical protein [Streptomyces sp. NBC_01754]WSC94824.1 hypothetical protein OG909_22500 [Streptomyces sp. NBC_01754]
MLVSLREALRRRETWVVGGEPLAQPGGRPAAGFRGQPGRPLRRDPKAQGPATFIEALKKKHRDALDRFEQALKDDTTSGVAIVKKNGEPWIKVSPAPSARSPRRVGETGGARRRAIHAGVRSAVRRPSA